MNYYVSYDSLWLGYFKEYCDEEVAGLPSDMKSWKQFFLASSYWKWDTSPSKRAEVVEVEPKHQRIASRPTNNGSNPAVLATHPLTSARSSFEVEVIKRGNWLGVGFCDDRFVLFDGPTLGTQTGCVNSSFFCQDSTTLRISGNKEKIALNKKIEGGDRIKVKVDFKAGDIYYYRNGSLEGILHAEVPLKESRLFPCVNVSHGTVISFVNDSLG